MQSILSVIAVLGVGSILAAAIGWRISIANHRQAWINALRDDIVTFLKESETLRAVTTKHRFFGGEIRDTEEERRQAWIAMMFVYWRIVLRLNRREPMHIELRKKLNAITAETDKPVDFGLIEEMVDLARKVLKREWDVTKYGIFMRPITWLKARWNPD